MLPGENWRAIEKPAEKLMRFKSKNKFHVLSAEESAKIKSKAGGVIERWYKEIAKKGMMAQNFSKTLMT